MCFLSQIYAQDVDFWEIESSDLQQMENEGLYPPRFVIDVCGTQAHSNGQVWINFSGMTHAFKSELMLDANRGMVHYWMFQQVYIEHLTWFFYRQNPRWRIAIMLRFLGDGRFKPAFQTQTFHADNNHLTQCLIT